MISGDGTLQPLTGSRFTDWLEPGTYHSRFFSQYAIDRTSPQNYHKDWVATARFDINSFWNIKVEGHFLDGTARGFHTSANPDGLKDSMKLLAACGRDSRSSGGRRIRSGPGAGYAGGRVVST